MNEVSQPVSLSIESIFKDSNYIIPLYQRNYAWGEAQVGQLIQDIWDYALEVKDTTYYIGTLVTYRRKINNTYIFETIDGQQRLTTINILLSVLKNEFDHSFNYSFEERLRFDSRKSSTATLSKLALNTKEQGQYNSKMLEAYSTIEKKLNDLIKKDSTTQNTFIDYLLSKVELLRVEVPHDTDLNHYFEIMNNRGEQLEKHEVVKASLLKPLKDDKQASLTFNLIWEACSNMEIYVQYGFKKYLRDRIFNSKWNRIPEDFDEVNKKVGEWNPSIVNSLKTNEGEPPNTFLDVLSKEASSLEKVEVENEDSTRFTSVVTFPNFLLHVLRIFSREDIPLDDKRLIIIFKNVLDKAPDKIKFVKEFGFALLKSKFLFDNYIIKRDFSKADDEWSLKSIKLGAKDKPYYSGTFDNVHKNKQLIMLLSMFHVSFPQMIYKHWLNGALFYLFENTSSLNMISAESYISYLERMSDAFYFDRFGENEEEYYNIIYKNKLELKNNEINKSNLNNGTAVQNFIFNRLDYLIWKSIEIKEEKRHSIHNLNKFEFSFRSSVEHFHPQNPKQGAILEPTVKEEHLDLFGNLCLISRHKNSELSNYSPLAKAEHYSKSSTVESLKQQLMLQQKDKWDLDAILKHQKEMILLLRSSTK